MTKRAVIITSSVLLAIVALFTILFGVVFRVRSISVAYDQTFRYSAQIDDIKLSSGLKKGKSIFAVDRSAAAQSIEKFYPYARVGVNITSLTSVKITLSNRLPLFYQVDNEKYYILDEDCKVLEITTDISQAQQYILLNQAFGLGDGVEVGEFIGDARASTCTSLYNALYSNAMLYIDGQDKFLDREDMLNVIKNIGFKKVNELNGKVDAITLKTSYGCSIEITEPSVNLDLKVNMAFSALREIISKDADNGTNKQASGTILVRYSYNADNQITTKCEYRA